jgi:hypothetical protein
MDDHREVPLEVLREFVRSYAELSTIRAVADDAGVSYKAVYQFIKAGTTPIPRNRRLLALWYLRRRGGLDDFEILRPYMAALGLLLGGTPEPDRDSVTLAMLAGLERGFVNVGLPPPRWMAVLHERITRTRPVW